MKRFCTVITLENTFLLFLQLPFVVKGTKSNNELRIKTKLSTFVYLFTNFDVKLLISKINVDF